MQPSPRLLNKNLSWNARLRVRVNTVVTNNGVYYINTSGRNSIVSNIDNWLNIGTVSASGSMIIDKTNVNIDISGDPFFTIDLSADGLPAFPANVTVYVSDDGNVNNYTVRNPSNYNPVTKILSGMQNPTDFPAQKIKIVVS